MKTIKEIKQEFKNFYLAKGRNLELPIYTFNGKLGVLYDDDGVDVFVPMDEFLANDKIEYDRVRWVTVYPGGEEGEEITDRPIRNDENDERLMVDCVWSPLDCNKSDEFVRELLVTTDGYYDWTSERSRMINGIQDALKDADENLGWYDGMKDENLDEDEVAERDEAIKDLQSLIKSYRESWEETCTKYSDPLGWKDYSKKSILFEDVYKEAVWDYDRQDLVSKTAWEAVTPKS